MRRVERANSLQRRHDRNVQRCCKAAEITRGGALDYSATGVDERSFTLPQDVEECGAFRFRHAPSVEILHPFAVAPQLEHAFTTKCTFPILDVLRNIQNDRTGPIAARDLECRPD